MALAMALATTCLSAGSAMAQDAQTTATTVCAGCHGSDGNSAIPMFPKLAGMQESYIVKQLRDFQSGRRRSDVMAPIIASLKPEEFAPLASYFSSQTPNPGAHSDKKIADVGKLLYFDGNEESGVPACLGCHQPGGAGHQIYPRIGGQHATYLAQQLRNFASAERSNDPNRFMRVVAKRMTEEEIQAVAEFLSGQNPK